MSSSSTLHSGKSETSSPRRLYDEENPRLPTDSNEEIDESSQRPRDEEALPLEAQEAQEAKKEKAEGDPFLVGWDVGDKGNPKNWSNARKCWLTFQLGILALAASVGSSIISPAEATIIDYTGISEEVGVLVVSLYILGFALGPLLWAPLSELFGRRWSMIPALYGLALFSVGTAVSQNAQSIIICRFLSGVFGSAPVSNVTAALGDFWAPKPRGMAVVFYAVAVVGGPTLGPLIGAALTVAPGLGWRWTEYILAIWAAAAATMAFFFFPEVYAPYLLKQKAQRLRKETGESRWHHPHEDVKIDIKSIVTKQLTRPLIMLFTEPMVTCISTYGSFVYGLLYMTLEIFPIVFEDERKWALVPSTLPFLGLFVGVLAAVVVNLGNQPRYARLVDQNKGRPVPEGRLPPMFLGGILFVIGMFWFGWTADPSILWVSPVIAAAFIGAGFNIIFQQCVNFLVDSYGMYAASAVSAQTFLRSLIAAGLPLAARPMLDNLGVGPAMSILGGIAALALPVPLIFMRYSYRLRKLSKFAPVHED